MKRFAQFLPLAAVLMMANAVSASGIEIDKEARLGDTTTSIRGVSTIRISVKDMSTALAFYKEATGYDVIHQETVSGNADADALFGATGLRYEVAVLKAPNMLLELVAFRRNQTVEQEKMASKGPGMTHTCFQSPASNPGWDKFVKAGATPLSFGGEPVDLGGYGVTYGYAHDPDGNIIELEQLDGEILARAGYDDSWAERGAGLWMSQVAFATHDLDRLMTFYQGVLGIKPYRLTEIKDNPKADAIVGAHNLHGLGGWFRLNDKSKVMEIWQYLTPETEEFAGDRSPTTLGYSYALEVGDIDAEYARLRSLGVEFFSEPVVLDGYWQVYARDPDSNVFSLRQPVDPESPYNVRALDAWAGYVE